MKTSIAIIGAGIAGITLARNLSALAEVTVFEKSRGLGGRMANRRREGFSFDHGAQYFTARSPAFKATAESAAADGDAGIWPKSVHTLKADGLVSDTRPPEPRYVGTPGMSAFAHGLAEGLHIRKEATVAAIVAADAGWALKWRMTGKTKATKPARELWDKIGYAAWACADPGLQFHTTVNDWHTCPASGEIRASNPCSEYMFLDDTACNLASLNLLAFLGGEGFDAEAYEHAVRLWTLTLEISVLMAQFPSREIAERSYEYRTLGLGYANLGGLMMTLGLPYDSDAGRALCGALTAMLTGAAYATSAEMAA